MIPSERKETIKYLYGYRCSACGRKRILTLHHVKPKWKAGENDDQWNLAPLCYECHLEIQPTIDTPNAKHSWTNLLWNGTWAHASPYGGRKV